MKQVNTNLRLIEAIDRVLNQHPEGIREFDLMTVLDKQYGDLYPKPDLSDQLLLFQHHFFLKHSLYRLQEQLALAGEYYLKIDQILISKIAQTAKAKQELTHHDPLRDYYLDLSNLNKETEQSVEALIQSFWRDLAKYHHQPEALKVLGLSGQENYSEQKKQYQRLAQQHHPDKGGDEAKFREIQSAWEKIKR